jgi:hypothetical protein
VNTLVQEDPTLLEEVLSASEDEQAGVCMCFFDPWSLFATTPQHSVMSISSDSIGSASEGSH